jgi:dTDP-4-amino-4,6-dideoxy-D-galactose acyltransferase
MPHWVHRMSNINQADTLVNKLSPLIWDSDFLGYGVARINAHKLALDTLDEQLDAARQAQVKLLYLVTTPEDAISNSTACAAGAWLADRKVTFGMELLVKEGKLARAETIYTTTTWTSRLESLALQSGEYSRFRLDTNFEPDVFAKLYKIWLSNSLSHQMAREVLVFEGDIGQEHKAELGILTLGVKQGRADIGLLAVDTIARGQRIGQQLVASAQQIARDWGLTEMQVVTQLANESACRFYRRCGFVEWQVEHIYHVWLR